MAGVLTPKRLLCKTLLNKQILSPYEHGQLFFVTYLDVKCCVFHCDCIIYHIHLNFANRQYKQSAIESVRMRTPVCEKLVVNPLTPAVAISVHYSYKTSCARPFVTFDVENYK